MKSQLLFILFFASMSMAFGQSPIESRDSFEENEVIEKPEILYPNPSYGKIRLNLGQYNLPGYQLAIKNIIGKDLWNQKLMYQETSLDLSFLKKGSYLFRIGKLDGASLRVIRLVIVDP